MPTILIVEDEKKIARFLELELKHEGYDVMTAFDGRTGLDTALQADPDLMILDLQIQILKTGLFISCKAHLHKFNHPLLLWTRSFHP